LDVDFLKLDASHLINIDIDRNARVIVSSIVAFARELGIETVGEYVHSESIFKTVIEIGVDMSQGYFWGRPEHNPRTAVG